MVRPSLSVITNSKSQMIQSRTLYSTPATTWWAEPASAPNRTPEFGQRQAFLGRKLTKDGLKATLTSEIRCYRSGRITRQSNYTRERQTPAGDLGWIRQLPERQELGTYKAPTVPGALGAGVPALRSGAWRFPGQD